MSQSDAVEPERLPTRKLTRSQKHELIAHLMEDEGFMARLREAQEEQSRGVPGVRLEELKRRHGGS